MSIKIDKNPSGKKDWHTYHLKFDAVDDKDGKKIEVQMMEDENLGLYGLMPLEDAVKIHKKLGEALEKFGDYKTEIIKNYVLERLAQSQEPVQLTTIEEEFQRRGISRTQTFEAIAELYKKDDKISEVIVGKRVAYKIVKSIK